jgi:hypothetical protein
MSRNQPMWHFGGDVGHVRDSCSMSMRRVGYRAGVMYPVHTIRSRHAMPLAKHPICRGADGSRKLQAEGRPNSSSTCVGGGISGDRLRSACLRVSCHEMRRSTAACERVSCGEQRRSAAPLERLSARFTRPRIRRRRRCRIPLCRRRTAVRDRSWGCDTAELPTGNHRYRGAIFFRDGAQQEDVARLHPSRSTATQPAILAAQQPFRTPHEADTALPHVGCHAHEHIRQAAFGPVRLRLTQAIGGSGAAPRRCSLERLIGGLSVRRGGKRLRAPAWCSRQLSLRRGVRGLSRGRRQWLERRLRL